MMEGIYALYYTGQAGTGFALLAMTNGVVVGADITGGTLDGDYEISPDGKTIRGKVQLKVPPGTVLVTGGPPSPNEYTLPIPFSLNDSDLDAARPIRFNLPTGPINIVFKKLRDLPR
jgi:hypothetical protein